MKNTSNQLIIPGKNSIMDNKLTLKQIDTIRFFKLPINESRIEDYRILQNNQSSIKIIDTKTGITYSSEYSEYSEARGMNCPRYKESNYINVLISGKTFEIKQVYCQKTNELLKRTLYIKNDTEELKIEQNMPGVAVDSRGKYVLDDNTRDFSVRYCDLNLEPDYWNLVMGYRTNNRGESFSVYIPEDCHLDYRDMPSYTTTIEKNNITTIFKLCNRFYYNIVGGCVETLDRNKLKEVFGYDGIGYNKFGNMDTTGIISAILYTGGITDSDDNRYNHTLKVLKMERGFQILYEIIRVYDKECVLNSCFEIPFLDTETITPEHIDSIIDILQKKYSNIFIENVIRELHRFKEEIKIKKGKAQRIVSRLSPLVFGNMSFDQILNEREGLFEEARKVFNEMAKNKNNREK